MTTILLAALAVLNTSAPVSDSMTITRLHYDGGGDWYSNPSSLPNLLEAIRDRVGIPVAMREATITLLDPGLRDHPYLYMNGHGTVRFSPAERAALRAYLLGGGFLHADDNYGMDESFREEMAKVFPDEQMVDLPPDHPIFHTFYDLDQGIPKVHEHDGKPPEALAIIHDGRLMVVYSYQSDLGDGWEDPDVHKDPPEIREAAIRMGVNMFVYVLGQSVP